MSMSHWNKAVRGEENGCESVRIVLFTDCTLGGGLFFHLIWGRNAPEWHPTLRLYTVTSVLGALLPPMRSHPASFPFKKKRALGWRWGVTQSPSPPVSNRRSPRQ